MRTAIVALTSTLLLSLACAGDPGTEPEAGGEPTAEDTETAEDASPETDPGELAQTLVLVDTHVDLPYRLNDGWTDVSRRTEEGHFDAVRAEEGGVDAAFMSIYVPAELGEGDEAYEHAETMIDLVERLASEHPETFRIVSTPEGVRKAHEDGILALPMGMENGSALGTDLGRLQHFFDRGIRYITLTHAENNQLSDSSYATDDRWTGLSPFGREVVAEMNRLGIMVDVSHLADEATREVIELSEAPVIASHSSVRALTPGFERNLSDELIRAIAGGGGVVQINFGSAFLDEEFNRISMKGWEAREKYAEEHDLEEDSEEMEAFRKEWREDHPTPTVTVSDVADHIDHVVELVGVEHVGFGSDFDGVSSLPEGLGDVSKYPNLLAELLDQGYTEEELAKIAGENLLRVWEEVREVAAGSV